MNRHKSDQSDRDALRVARVQGVNVVRQGRTWSWRIQSFGANGFTTAYAAARAGLTNLERLLEERVV